MRHGVPRRLIDLLRRGVARVGHVLLQQQAVAEVAPVLGEGLARGRVLRACLEDLQSAVGFLAGLDPVMRRQYQFGHPGHLLVEAAGRDQAERPGDLDRVAGRVANRCPSLDNRFQPKNISPTKVASRKKAISSSMASGAPKMSPT